MAQRIKTKQEVLREFPEKIESLTMPTREYVEVFPYFGMSLEKAESENKKLIESGEKSFYIPYSLIADDDYIMHENQGLNGIRDNVHERSKQAGNWAKEDLRDLQIEAIVCISTITPESSHSIRKATRILLDLAGRFDVDLSNIEEI
jgi:hypothetical protein